MVGDQATFWQVTGEIAKLVQKEKQIGLSNLCREADKVNVALQQAQEQCTFIPEGSERCEGQGHSLLGFGVSPVGVPFSLSGLFR